jgi:DNA gyrase/topoisomerase IV subunit B
MKAKTKTDDRDIKTLDAVSHILLRPNMYVGGVKPSESEVWVLNEDGSISYKKVTYVEGLLKITQEAVDNSIDEGIKTNWEYSTKINVKMDKNTFSIEDNGRGIPVKKNDAGEWMCVNAVCKTMSGSNFNDDNRNTIGTNGIGIKAANIFSTAFECITCDGKGKMKIECANNLSSTKIKELTPTAKTGTQITFTPDFKRFSVKCFDDNIIMMVKTRLKFLSWFFPKCSITFNGEKINIKAKELSTMFPQPSIVLNTPNVYLCVYPSEEPYVLSYVNGISLREGGSHVDYVANKVIDGIRDKVSKKFKSIKPADIRNRIGIVLFFNNFPNCAFDSQTKEKLTNAWSEISTFLADNEVNLDTFTNKILSEKEIINNITELFRLKEELAEQKELAKLNKSKKEVSSEKYFPPVGKTDKKYLMITEGFSAFSGISPILGRKGIGYYMLKGKIKNVLDEKPSSFMKNQEVQELVQILGINVGGETTDMNYEKVVILTDADSDGNAIAGLIITLFSIIAPQMLKDGRICRLNTPLLIGRKGDKVVEYYFSFPKKTDMKKTLDYFYLKGLGSWSKALLNQVIESEGGMDNLLKPFEFDKKASKSIYDWYGKDSEPRKNFLRGREFHIDKV